MDSPYMSGSIIDSPIALLLTRAGPRGNAATISFFSEVAHHPTTLWIAIAASSYTHELLCESHQFTLVVLHRGQAHLARLCGSASGRQQDKCAHLALSLDANGRPYLHDALASVFCGVRSAHPLDDHVLFIAEIVGGSMNTRTSFRPHLLLADLL